MSIEVLSPYNGQPVKIRPQDVDRAIRDVEGRLFYALPRSDGTGYYGAMTRAGGQKDELRDTNYRMKLAQGRKKTDAHNVQVLRTERGKAKSRKWIGRLVLLALAAAAAYYLFRHGLPL